MAGGAPAGNKNGAKAKIWEGAIRRALAKRSEGNIDSSLETLANKLISAAEQGEQWALVEIGNRLDGKPAQIIIGGDDDDPPVKIQKVERVIVRAKPESTDG